MRFDKQIINILQQCYRGLRLVYTAKHILRNKSVKAQFCQSLVTSKMLYGLVIYYPWLTSIDRHRLQIMPNTCYRFVNDLRKFDYILHEFSQSVWLNVCFL